MRPILTQIQISIHASAKEATNSNHFALKLDNYFNPRLREGGDGKTTIISFPLEEISIHASAKEATDIQKQAEERMDISIHASAKEATRAGYQVHTVKIFQSTPPRRRRPQHIVIPQLSCTYLVSTTFLSTIFSFISQYVVLFFLF